MNDRETRRYDMFKRAQIFGKDNANDFPADKEGARRFASLATVIVALDSAKVGQLTGRTRTTTTAKEVLLDALKLDMQNISRTARAISQDEPGFADKFRMPSNPADGALLTTADAFLLELGKKGVTEKFV